MAKVRDRVLELLGGVSRAELDQAVHQAAARAYEAGQDDANDEPSSGDLSSFGYRRASAGSVRELGDLDYGKVQEIAWRVFLLSPVAKRYLQLKRDYELGRGLVPHSDDPQLHSLLQAFWDDNGLRARLKQYVHQWHLLGEQLLPVFVRSTDGRVRLGYIDPVEIDRVITDPDNVLDRVAVVLKRPGAPPDPWLSLQDGPRVYRIIRKDEGVVQGAQVLPGQNEGRLVTAEQAQLADWERVMLQTYGLDEYTGSCIYWARNALSNQSRGYTDLLQVADWIDQDEGVYFDLAERENLAGYFFADVSIADASKEQVLARAQDIKRSPPTKGSMNIHSASETWTLHAPDLKQQPSIATGNELLTVILGGLGIPRHWYGHGDETNRATAEAQGDPTWRTMENDQDAVKDFCMLLCQLAWDQALIAGKIMTAEAEIEIDVPEMTTKDTAGITTALGSLSTALMVAEDRGWITRSTAAAIFARVASELGVEISAEDELALADADQDAAQLGQAEDANSWLRAHGVLVAGAEPTIAPLEDVATW